MRLFFNILKKKNSKKRILFAGVNPTNFIQFRPIYRVLESDPRIEIFFSGMCEGKDRPDRLWRPFGIEKKLIIREKIAKRFDFDMYISPDHHLVGNRHTTSVQMFHTTSFRNFSIDERVRDFQHLFLLGPYMKRRFLETGVSDGKEQQFEEIGMPQTDTLLEGADTALADRLNLDKNLPTILYAPVWVPIEDILKDVQSTLQALTLLKANLLIKMHYIFYRQELNEIKWPEYLNALLEKNKNMHLVNDYDITPYMRISDLLVSDTSAVVHQFSILDRPIVCMKVNIERFKEIYPNLDREAYYARAVVEASAGEDINDAVYAELTSPGNLSHKRQAMAKEYFYNIGSAAKYAVGKIYKFLNLEEKRHDQRKASL